jgi:hypothetical protein
MVKFKSIKTISFILIGLILAIFFFNCSEPTPEPVLSKFDVTLDTTSIKTGESVAITVTAKDNNGNTYTDFNDTVTISCTNSNISVDSSTRTSSNFANGVLSGFEVKLTNNTDQDQSGKINVENGDYKGSSSSNITVTVVNFYEKGKIIFPYSPKNTNVKEITSIERDIKLGNTNISNPILLGKDKSSNFIAYIKSANKVVKFSQDGSLGAIVLDSNELNAVSGDVIAGIVDSNNMYLLKQNSNNEVIMMFYDISGNLNEDAVNLGTISAIVNKYSTTDYSSYNFEAIDMGVLNGNPVIVIREKSNGQKNCCG